MLSWIQNENCTLTRNSKPPACQNYLKSLSNTVESNLVDQGGALNFQAFWYATKSIILLTSKS